MFSIFVCRSAILTLRFTFFEKTHILGIHEAQAVITQKA